MKMRFKTIRANEEYAAQLIRLGEKLMWALMGVAIVYLFKNDIPFSELRNKINVETPYLILGIFFFIFAACVQGKGLKIYDEIEIKKKEEEKNKKS